MVILKQPVFFCNCKYHGFKDVSLNAFNNLRTKNKYYSLDNSGSGKKSPA